MAGLGADDALRPAVTKAVGGLRRREMANSDVIFGVKRYEQMRQTSLYVSLMAQVKEKTLLLDSAARKMTTASDLLLSESFSPKPHTPEERRLLSVPERFLDKEERVRRKKLIGPPSGNKIYLHTLEKVVRVPTGAISFALIGLDAVVAIVTCEGAKVTLPLRRSEILVAENPDLALLAGVAPLVPEIKWEMAQMAGLDMPM